MDGIRVEFNKVYQGTILEINITNNIEIDYITLQIQGNAMGCIVLESTPVLLVFVDRNSKFKCTIPKETLPSITLNENFYIHYEAILNVFKGLNKVVISYPFEIYSSYLYNKSEYSRINIDTDMIDTTSSCLGLDTSFSKIVKKLRALGNSSHLVRNDDFYSEESKQDDFNEIDLKNTFISIIKEKNQKIQGLKDFINETITKYKDKGKGDIFFYSDYKTQNITNKTKNCKVKKEDNLCDIRYNYYIKENIELTIEYFQNVENTSVSLIYMINGEHYKEDPLYTMISDGYFYKVISIPRNDNLNFFTFTSYFFKLDCYLQVEVDNVKIKLPIVLVDQHSTIVLD